MTGKARSVGNGAAELNLGFGHRGEKEREVEREREGKPGESRESSSGGGLLILPDSAGRSWSRGARHRASVATGAR